MISDIMILYDFGYVTNIIHMFYTPKIFFPWIDMLPWEALWKHWSPPNHVSKTTKASKKEGGSPLEELGEMTHL